MPNIGPMELVIVLVVVMLIMGPRRLPAAGRALGEGLRGFRETLSGNDRTHARALDSAEPPPAP